MVSIWKGAGYTLVSVTPHWRGFFENRHRFDTDRGPSLAIGASPRECLGSNAPWLASRTPQVWRKSFHESGALQNADDSGIEQFAIDASLLVVRFLESLPDVRLVGGASIEACEGNSYSTPHGSFADFCNCHRCEQRPALSGLLCQDCEQDLRERHRTRAGAQTAR